MAECPPGPGMLIPTRKRKDEKRRRSGRWNLINSSEISTTSRGSPGSKSSGEYFDHLCECALNLASRDVLEQPNLASAGAATSAAVPSADTYSADEDDDMDVKEKDTDVKPNGTDKVS
jgi:hypothetical protein